MLYTIKLQDNTRDAKAGWRTLVVYQSATPSFHCPVPVRVGRMKVRRYIRFKLYQSTTTNKVVKSTGKK